MSKKILLDIYCPSLEWTQTQHNWDREELERVYCKNVDLSIWMKIRWWAGEAEEQWELKAGWAAGSKWTCGWAGRSGAWDCGGEWAGKTGAWRRAEQSSVQVDWGLGNECDCRGVLAGKQMTIERSKLAGTQGGIVEHRETHCWSSKNYLKSNNIHWKVDPSILLPQWVTEWSV